MFLTKQVRVTLEHSYQSVAVEMLLAFIPLVLSEHIKSLCVYRSPLGAGVKFGWGGEVSRHCRVNSAGLDQYFAPASGGSPWPWEKPVLVTSPVGHHIERTCVEYVERTRWTKYCYSTK